MVIRNLNSFDPSVMAFEPPVKNGDVYFSKARYNSRSLLFQSDLIYFRSFENGKLKILLSKKMFQFMTKIERQTIELISEHSEKWFNMKLTIDQVRQIYKSSLIFPSGEPNSVLTEINSIEEPMVFNSHEKKIKLEDFKKDTPIIILARLKGITFYRSNCIPNWEFLSVKSKVVLMENKCIINSDSDESENENQNENQNENEKMVKVINFENN